MCQHIYYQPQRRHSNATYQNVDPNKAPSQIDLILVSSRWATSIRDSKTSWSLPISAYGRKYDHALVKVTYRTRLKCDNRSQRKNFALLNTQEVAQKHESIIISSIEKTPKPLDAASQWNRLATALHNAQSAIPKLKSSTKKKWETSLRTLALVEKRTQSWNQMSSDEQKVINKEISRSSRDDYRNYVGDLVEAIEDADKVGNASLVFRLAKQLSSTGRGNPFCQPAKDENGKPITSVDQQLELWAAFLERKFAPCTDETIVNLEDSEHESIVPDISIDEVMACVSKLKSGKAPGPDSIPVEQFKYSKTACRELLELLNAIWIEEDVPENLVSATMLMLYKKKTKDDRRNYRALGLLNHAYKVFAMILLLRIIPFIETKISDMQAGFRQKRGCRDNLLILSMTVHHILESAEDYAKSQGIITYIDFSAAFDSIKHSYLLESLKLYEVPLKYCRMIRAIYNHATVKVRVQQPGGAQKFSRSVSIKRGVIQGDIPSSACFLVALDRLMREHGSTDIGIQLTPDLALSDIAFADDEALGNKTTEEASVKISNLSEHAETKAGMSISVPKTKAQHIRKKPRLSKTTESDVQDLPDEMKFKFNCENCGMCYPTKHGLSIHKARWCKGDQNAAKPSRTGTVADRIVKRMKVDKFQQTLGKVMMGQNEIDNVYTHIYLGAEYAGDGDPEIPVTHRSNIAWGRFGEYRQLLTATKLPIALRLRFYSPVVVSTMTYGSEAWFLTDKIKKKINGLNSKMVSQITKKSIHAEAKNPSFDILEHILKRRWCFLGHILRVDESRAVRRFLLELSPSEAPFIPGSLLADTKFRSVQVMTDVAADRGQWLAARSVYGHCKT